MTQENQALDAIIAARAEQVRNAYINAVATVSLWGPDGVGRLRADEVKRAIEQSVRKVLVEAILRGEFIDGD